MTRDAHLVGGAAPWRRRVRRSERPRGIAQPMPVHDSPQDDPEADRARAAQEDPWVMHLVVRMERPVALEALLAAAARATVDAYTLADDPRYTESFRAWEARSFRKVCLRAAERDWPRVLELPAGSGKVGGVEVVRALPPRLRSAREKLLARLQALTDPPEGAPVAAEPPAGDQQPVMLFVINASVPMRAGKMTAQVAHAVLMCEAALAPRYPEAFAGWDLAGRPCAVRLAPPGVWEALCRTEDCVVVRDAGLTEVTPGAQTVMALAPRPSGEWPAGVAGLPRP